LPLVRAFFFNSPFLNHLFFLNLRLRTMQVLPMISALLAGLIILLSLHAVDSLSVSRRSEPQLLTLPLHPIPKRTDIHPQMLLQLHINRAIRRLATMTGAEPPSDQSLKQRLERRMLSLNDPSDIDRRFNRIDVHNEGDVQLEKRFNQVGVSKRNETDVTIAEAPTASDSLGLDIEGRDIGYLATVQIGKPPRDFLILMDTGSADFWVGSEDCNVNDGGCGNHTFLGPTLSSSFTSSSETFQVTYGTGHVGGDLVSDDVTIAGLTLSNHVFGVANDESVDFSDDSVPFDGLMGLAQSDPLSEQKTLTPLEALKHFNLVTAAIVSFKIPREADNKNDGEVTFGGYDPNKFKSNTRITIPNVSPLGFWEASYDEISVDGQKVEALINRTAILDTGTTLIVAPEGDVTSIHAKIPNATFDKHLGGFRIPCANTAIVTFTFGGQKFPIDSRDLAIDDGNGGCVSGIVAGDVGGKNEWLVGDVFLKNVYFSADTGKNAISLAILT